MAAVDDAVDIHVKDFPPGGGTVCRKRSDLPQDSGTGDEGVDPAPKAGHIVHGGLDLVGVADIGLKTEGGAAGGFDFKPCGVEFRLVAPQQAYPGTCFGKTEGEALSDSPTGTRNQNPGILG